MYMEQFSNDLDNDNDNDTWNNASIDSWVLLSSSNVAPAT